MRAVLTFLIVLGLVTLSSGLDRQYYFINNPMNWTDAQSYCRENYIDLATVEDDNDQNRLITTITTSFSSNGGVWIGLYEDVLNSWKWYLNDDTFYGPGERDYRNWVAGEPNNYRGNEMCTEMLGNGFWNDLACDNLLHFACYNGVNNSFVVVKVGLKASDARQYCREYYTDLASIRNTSDNERIQTLAEGQSVWIGLYRTWLWSDQSNSTYADWIPGMPDNAGEQEHCVAVQLSYSGNWDDFTCYSVLPFACYSDTTVITTTSPVPAYVIGMRARLISSRNLTQSDIKNLLQNVLMHGNFTSAIRINVTRVTTIT